MRRPSCRDERQLQMTEEVKRSVRLTRFLPELDKAEYGKWVIDRENDGPSGNPLHFPFMDYDGIVDSIWDAIYDFEKDHEDFELMKYSEILSKSNIERNTQSMKEADVSKLDGQTVMALLMAATRIERFCEGAMLDFLGSGCISKWLQRLKDIDDGVESNPNRTDRYRILITTRHGGTREVTGTFDKDGLPSDWPEFAENLRDFLASHGIGGLLDDRVYGKARRRKDDLVFCNVVFHDGGGKYCYLADDDDFDIGDAVVVPVGQDNHEAFVRIESIEYHPAEDAPWPVDKIKHILRRFDADKDRNLPGSEDE